MAPAGSAGENAIKANAIAFVSRQLDDWWDSPRLQNPEVVTVLVFVVGDEVDVLIRAPQPVSEASVLMVMVGVDGIGTGVLSWRAFMMSCIVDVQS